jgi:hypothetical protein
MTASRPHAQIAVRTISPLARAAIWAATRVALYMILVVGFLLHEAVSGNQYVTDTPGLRFGLGLPLLFPITTVLSALCWIGAAAANARLVRPGASRAVLRVGQTLIVAAAIADALLYAVQLLSIWPNTLPFFAAAAITSVIGGWLLLRVQAHGWTLHR